MGVIILYESSAEQQFVQICNDPPECLTNHINSKDESFSPFHLKSTSIQSDVPPRMHSEVHSLSMSIACLYQLVNLFFSKKLSYTLFENLRTLALLESKRKEHTG